MKKKEKENRRNEEGRWKKESNKKKVNSKKIAKKKSWNIKESVLRKGKRKTEKVKIY